MALHILPARTGHAAENMALDFLLLQRYPAAEAVRFRHYGWQRPAFTFGYSQKIADVRARLPRDERLDLCRRPTGGGLVDHRDDWTFALVIPRGHPLEEVRATESYRQVHETLAAALRVQGIPARLQTVADAETSVDTEPAPLIAGVCFEKAEVHDVVHRVSGAKLAGAAQKRNKRGLLFQGSLARPSLVADGVVFDADRLLDDFTAGLARLLETDAEPTPWPDLNEDEVSGLIEQYSSPEWVEHR